MEGTFDAAAKALAAGASVVIPTDTVYGIAVAVGPAASPQAIFDIKQRDAGKAIPLLVADPADLDRYGLDVPAYAHALAAAFWPGALTLVVRASDAIPPAFRAADGTVALRCPNDQRVRELIRRVGAPLATSSANTSEQPAPASIQQLEPRIAQAVAVVVDGGPCTVGIPSTGVTCTAAAPLVWREGAIPTQEILAVAVKSATLSDDTIPSKEHPMSYEEGSFPSFDDVSTIHYEMWLPEGEPKAVLQIVHGMCEFVHRYDAFARYLNEHGIAVVGHDHIAHGSSVADPKDWGVMDPRTAEDVMINDVQGMRNVATARFGFDVPYFILGHSMGSFIVRCYLGRLGAGGYEQEGKRAGAIVMGTGFMPTIVPTAGGLIASIIGKVKGNAYRSTFMNNMGIGGYNKAFEPARTPVDWLSRNEANVDTYIAEPRCTYMFSVGGYKGLMDLVKECCADPCFASTPLDLPILVTAGECDPVGDMGKAPRSVFEKYKEAGVEDVKLLMYAEDRHEILNEVDRDKVFADMLQWMEERI